MKIQIKHQQKLDMRSRMRRVTEPMIYQKAVSSISRGPDAYAQLKMQMYLHTQLNPTAYSGHKGQKNSFDLKQLANPPTTAELRKRLEKGRAQLVTLEVEKNKRIFAAAYKNEPYLKKLLFPQRSDERTITKDANIEFMHALIEYSWKVSPVELDAYFENYADTYASVTQRFKNALLANYTAEELHLRLKKLGKHKTYADYEGRAVHLFDMGALGIVADSFNERTKNSDPETMIRQVTGIATGKSHKETENRKILHRENRPIGLAEVLDALFFICQNARISPIVAELTPKCMHGFIPGREGHDMIAELFFTKRNQSEARSPRESDAVCRGVTGRPKNPID